MVSLKERQLGRIRRGGRTDQMKHMKFKRVTFDNKKRTFHLEYTSGLKIDCPYSALSIKGKVTEAAPDSEVRRHSFYFDLENGKNFFP